MDSLTLLFGLCPLLAAGLGFLLPIFNRGLKEELENLSKEKADLLARLERMELRLDEKDRKLQKVTQQLDEVRKEADEHRERGKQLKEEARKARRLEQEVQDKEGSIAQAVEARDRILKQVQEELHGFKQKGAEMAEQLRQVKEENRQLQAKLVEAQKAPPPPPPPRERPAPDPERPPRVDPREAAERERLRSEVSELRKAAAATEFQMRLLRRKVEHNRRAYTVTMLQLDLAQDELCLLKTGRVRRETRLAREQVPPPAPDDKPCGTDDEAAVADEGDDDGVMEPTAPAVQPDGGKEQ
jgi:chromosome segregation ATPase